MNRHIVIGALAALLFVTGAVLSLIRGETLMVAVLGLGALAFIVRTVLAVRSSSRKKDECQFCCRRAIRSRRRY